MNTVTPEEAGFSSTRLSRIGPVMQRYVDENKLAGIISMVARHGKIAHLEKVGMMDIEAGKSMEFDTVLRIYSMTKPITSVAVLMLYEEARFHLSDPVSRFIPGFADVKVFLRKTDSGVELADLEREITIRDLLTHTAGLSYGFEEDSYVDSLYQKRVWAQGKRDPRVTLEEVIEALTHIPLLFQPGTRFQYSMATDVLGYLVQVVSGMPFDDFLKQRIFEPLGMVDTGFHVPESKVGRFAANYSPAVGGGLELLDALTTSRYAKPTVFPSGGGGLVSTTTDYIRFAQMLLNKGEFEGVRLLGRKTIELMTTDHLPAALHVFEDRSRGFGLGVGVLRNLGLSQALGSVGTYGWGGAANTNFWIDPKEDLIGLLMLQFMPSGTYPVIADFRTLVYQALVD